ncbi:winged helix-turn-helix domain-containing protein [Peristeroidobacter agariperforans]|uniref:winged helix-turn-helix domain-containing protein n=1 Tax=Peristeroidobacter agariperforans TaxID=268404 RepID=UPI0018E56559|nr:crosslink repair DNA glycosylase YcaQ family protein [Peristeroidobacter agariperforans]
MRGFMGAAKDSLSIGEARRVALEAQQFLSAGAAPRSGKALAEMVRRLGVVQMDSVNVLVRSHYLPVFSRRGDYKSTLLERAAYDERLLFEYWGHEASLLPIESYPLFRWRMDDARKGVGTWGRLKRYATSHQELVKSAIDQIRERGPLGASELTDAGKSKGSWWGWSQGKEILEWLFWIGDVTTARRRNFERLYELPERVLPEAVRNAPVPSREHAQRELMMIGARAMGVASARDLRDYFRLPANEAATRLAELVEEGKLLPVSVEGWKQQGYLHHEAKIPRASKVADVAALLSPFDSLIWERQRTERLFDFHFRLEIYTPVHKRLHGYYVLPLLLGERIVGRVDLKSERQSGQLQVKGGSVEPGVVPARVVEPLAKQLSGLARWLGLENYAVTSRKGELMRALKKLKAR